MALDVLIVDDSAAIRKILQRVLHQAEVPLGNVYEAGDGQEALDSLQAQKVGLILTDIPDLTSLRTSVFLERSSSLNRADIAPFGASMQSRSSTASICAPRVESSDRIWVALIAPLSPGPQ